LFFPGFQEETGEAWRGEYLLLTSVILEFDPVKKPRETCEFAVNLGIKNLPVLQGVFW